ncbi:MAG: sigma-54 interaction domain-containing protein [Bacteroidota bacterium]
MDIKSIKRRYEIIGNYSGLDRAIDIAIQVAPTDLSVLITGRSGTGKEVFPQIIHQFSKLIHGAYIPVNCGAIPEGTIDSELFGHEKGSFTGAHEKRKGYFEEADGGTIFLDEVSELPFSTQVRLLRILETGEYLKVGSSKVQKTNVRVIAATNEELTELVKTGKFREDLFYRLNTVPINIPPLKERGDDIYLLFRKFANDFAEYYRMPPVTLTDDAKEILLSYEWPGNIRQLKNITEQISIIEKERTLDADLLRSYLPNYDSVKLPALVNSDDGQNFTSEREILYKILFDMKNDMNDLKRLVLDTMASGECVPNADDYNPQLIQKISESMNQQDGQEAQQVLNKIHNITYHNNIQDTKEIIEESLSLEGKERELIKKALEKYEGRRKRAAEELGISERTLYRKIKEYNIM